MTMDSYQNFPPYPSANQTATQDYTNGNYMYDNQLASAHSTQNNTMHRPWEAMSTSHSPESVTSSVYSPSAGSGQQPQSTNGAEYNSVFSKTAVITSVQQQPDNNNTTYADAQHQAKGHSSSSSPLNMTGATTTSSSAVASLVPVASTSALTAPSSISSVGMGFNNSSQIYERYAALMRMNSSVSYQSKEYSDAYTLEKGKLDTQYHMESEEARKAAYTANYASAAFTEEAIVSAQAAIDKKYDNKMAELNLQAHQQLCILEQSASYSTIEQVHSLPPPYPQTHYMPSYGMATQYGTMGYGAQAHSAAASLQSMVTGQTYSPNGVIGEYSYHIGNQHQGAGETSRFSPTGSSCSYGGSSNSESSRAGVKGLHSGFYDPHAMMAGGMGSLVGVNGAIGEDIKPATSAAARRQNSHSRLSRKSKHLNAKVVEAMNQWYERHTEYPYPDYDTVQWIANLGPISMEQVKKWFCNKRTRSSNTRKLKDIAELRRKFLPETVNRRLKGFEGH